MSLPDDHEFEVALSFAGEQRSFVEAVASALAKRGIRTFYDADQEIELWGKNLIEEFQRIYQRASRVVVMFLSSDYARKEWTRHERRSALSRAFQERREYVLPVRFDDVEIDGLDTSISFLLASSTTPEGLADKVEAKLVYLRGKVVAPAAAAFRSGQMTSPWNTAVTVEDRSGEPIEGAQVVLVAHNGTQTESQSDASGKAHFQLGVRRAVSVFVAHSSYLAAYHPDHDNGRPLRVTLPLGDGVGSIAFPESTGYLPRFRPRLNPIGSNHDQDAVPGRIYMYVDNSSVDGQSEQPFHFLIGQELLIEDAEGHQIRAKLVGFVGQSTLWEYRSPDE